MLLQAQTTLEESQRMTAIRKAYQRAIVTPTHHVEQLWKDYENFENSVSRALVRLHMVSIELVGLTFYAGLYFLNLCQDSCQ